jgi:sulfur-carrier protein adenylyltransferase/sulfurtransferase
MLATLTPLEIRDALATRRDLVLVDVREPAEHAIAAIAGARLVPLHTLPQHVHALPRDHEIVLYCHHGVRSDMAGQFLVAHGFPRVSHMQGGINRWSEDVDHTIAKY